MNDAQNMQQQAEEFRTTVPGGAGTDWPVIVGHDEIVHGVLTCLFVGGHCLLEGVPGLGKTMLIRTLAEALGSGLLPDSVHARSDAGRHPGHQHGDGNAGWQADL